MRSSESSIDKAVTVTPSGPILGTTDGRVYRATGIPYAAARRFRYPVPAPDHDEMLEACSPGPMCPQIPVPYLEDALGYSSADYVQDENCLHLSITAPADAQEERPVMVWFHGGSYVAGAGDAAITDPLSLVLEQDVVVVRVTYRLGLFGYLGGTRGRPANLGLFDQICALRWIQRNISSFGGDPSMVTIFGQSAGADSVLHLMASVGREGLFDRAIVQSAPLGLMSNRSALAASMLSATSDVSASMTTAEVLGMQALAEKSASGFGLASGMPFSVQYGYPPLPPEDEFYKTLEETASNIPVLIGSTAQEANLFLEKIPFLQGLPAASIAGRCSRRVVERILTQLIYARPVEQFCQRYLRAGGTVFKYRLTWAPEGGPLGSAHTIDLPLLFGDEESWRRARIVRGADWSKIEVAGRQVRALWANFARGQLRESLKIEGVISVERYQEKRFQVPDRLRWG